MKKEGEKGKMGLLKRVDTGFETNPKKLFKGLLHLISVNNAFIGIIGMACFFLFIPLVGLMAVCTIFRTSNVVTIGVIVTTTLLWVWLMACVGIQDYEKRGKR